MVCETFIRMHMQEQPSRLTPSAEQVGGAAHGAAPNIAPLSSKLLALLLWFIRPLSSVDRLGQQMAVLTKKFVMLIASALKADSVYGIARMEPRRTSWSSVRSTMMCGAEPPPLL